MTEENVEQVEVVETQEGVETQVETQEGVETKEGTVSNDDFTERFNALSKREKELREEHDRIKSQAEKYKEYEDLDTKVKENPLSILDKFGLSLDDLIMSSLGEDAPPKTVEEQLEELKAKIQAGEQKAIDKEKAQAEAQAKAREEAEALQIANFKQTIKDFVAKNEDEYKVIKMKGAEDAVFGLIDGHFNKTGELMDLEVATKKVEEGLRNEIAKYLELEIFKKKEEVKKEWDFGQEELYKENEVDLKTKNVQSSHTLTSDMTSTPSVKERTEKLTYEESLQRAAEMLKWD